MTSGPQHSSPLNTYSWSLQYFLSTLLLQELLYTFKTAGGQILGLTSLKMSLSPSCSKETHSLTIDDGTTDCFPQKNALGTQNIL